MPLFQSKTCIYVFRFKCVTFEKWKDNRIKFELTITYSFCAMRDYNMMFGCLRLKDFFFVFFDIFSSNALCNKSYFQFWHLFKFNEITWISIIYACQFVTSTKFRIIKYKCILLGYFRNLSRRNSHIYVRFLYEFLTKNVENWF